MGKRLSQQDLLAEIETEHSKLVQVLDSIPDRVKTKRGMNADGWAIKDVLTHVVDWQQRGNAWYLAGKSGVEPAIPDEEFNWGEIRKLNEKIFRTNRRKSLAQVLDEFERVHKQTLKLIKKMSPAEFTTLHYYSWTGNSWVLSDYFRANTASHYRWAHKKIKKWLKLLDSQDG